MQQENKGILFYWFKSEKQSQSLNFTGDVIQTGMAKKLIDDNRAGQKQTSESFKRQIHYDYNIYEAGTLRKITNELELIPSNSNLVVEWVPIAFADVTYYSNPQQKLDFKNSGQSLKKQMAAQNIQINDVPKQVYNAINQQHFKQEETMNTQPQQQIVDENTEQISQITKSGIKAYFTREEFMQSLDKAWYFVIRSSNFENIQISWTYGEWATTKVNESRLNEAFNSVPHVYLIFTVSKIQEFKGFARMNTVASKQSGHWKNTESIKLGGCFQIQWITTASLPFLKIKNLTNSYQNNDLVKNSWDCTELDLRAGKEVCRLFDIPCRDPSIPPEAFIIKANSQMNVTANQIALQQVNYIDKSKLQEIEQQKAAFSYSQRPLINALLQHNPQLLVQLAQISDEQFQDVAYYTSMKIQDKIQRLQRKQEENENKIQTERHKKISKNIDQQIKIKK